MINITQRFQLDISITPENPGGFANLERLHLADTANECLAQTREGCQRVGSCTLSEVAISDVSVPSDELVNVSISCSSAEDEGDLDGCALTEWPKPGNLATQIDKALQES